MIITILFDIIFLVIITVFSILGLIYVHYILKKKTKIYYLITISLIVGVLEEIITNIKNEFTIDSMTFQILLVISAIMYFFMIYSVNLLYVYRIRSLGGYIRFETESSFVPLLCLISSIIIQVMYIINLYTTLFSKSFYIITTLIFFTISIILEIFISVVLIIKILVMFDYRIRLQRLTIFKIIIYLIIITLFESSIFFIRIFYYNPNSPEGHIRILGFVVRINIIIDFYHDVINDIIVNTELIRMQNFNGHASSYPKITTTKRERTSYLSNN